MPRNHDQASNNPMPRPGRKLALGGAIAIGALANLAPAALANRVNKRAEKAAVTLAQKMLYGKVNAQGGVSVRASEQGGRQLLDSTVVVGQPPKGGAPEEYQFTVLAPATPQGDPDLKHLIAVTASEGPVDALGNMTRPNVAVDFVRNSKTGGWAILASSRVQGRNRIAEAGAIPVQPHEARLTGTEVAAAFHEANALMIDRAIGGDALLNPGLPFPQAPGTEPNLLK